MEDDDTPRNDVARRPPLRERDRSTTNGRCVDDPTRRSVLGGLAAAAASGLVVGSASGGNHGRDAGSVPTPDVEGPVTGGARTGQPQTSIVADVRSFGYIEDEYFLSGTARPLGSSLTGLADSESPADYKTRMLVYRPLDPDRFNGSLVVNWPNVTSQLDVPYAFVNTYEYLFRNGYAVAIPSVQKQGVDGSPLAMRNWDPARYTDVHHPGDEFSYDMFSQSIESLLAEPAPEPDPLMGLDPETVVAMGISQSAGFLRTYINEVQADHRLVDGFMPQHSGSVPETADDIRDDLVPVLWLNSEDEADNDPREDGGLFKLWETAGASHVNNWDNAWWRELQLRDHGNVAGVRGGAEWDPDVEGQYGARGGSGCPNNLFPARFAYRAGLHRLHEWVTKNKEPPSAPRIEREAGDAKTDDDGNALGGLRLPPIEVPVATYAARECGGLFGETRQFDQATLDERYPSHADYVEQMEAATKEAQKAGWLLEPDAEELLDRARSSPIPERSEDDRL